MKFCIIDPSACTAKMTEAKDPQAAMLLAGLQPGKVDFGSLTRNLHVVVYEFGLYLPMDQQKFFSIGRNLYVGGAVLFASDDEGNTVNLNSLPPVMFYKNAAAVEQAIGRGEIERPITAINDQVLWQWPQPG